MKYLVSALIVSAITVSSLAVAKPSTLTFKRDGMTITLTQKKCSNPTVLTILAEVDPKIKWYAGTVVTMDKQKSEMCYTVNPADHNHIYVVDETGDNGPLLIKEPKKAPGI